MKALLLALLLGACAPPEFHFPAATELECAVSEQAVYTNRDPSYCVRLTASDGAEVKLSGTDGCDAWQACLILAPGETAVHGSGLANPGLVQAVEHDCSEVPPCP